MARREIDDEKKSYSGIFLLAVGLLLMGSVWSIWDDSVSRRPWKKYQAQFSRIVNWVQREVLVRGVGLREKNLGNVSLYAS